jgi:hypothetical protein
MWVLAAGVSSHNALDQPVKQADVLHAKYCPGRGGCDPGRSDVCDMCNLESAETAADPARLPVGPTGSCPRCICPVTLPALQDKPQLDAWEWDLHIVYNHSFCVPVCYFRVTCRGDDVATAGFVCDRNRHSAFVRRTAGSRHLDQNHDK